MSLQTSTLRPGLLVSLRTTISGNVKYRSNTLEAGREVDGGAVVEAWETIKTTMDPEEQERATEARSKARHAVVRNCAQTSFGLLCPEVNKSALEDGIAEANRIVSEFNATAKFSRIGVYTIAAVIKGDEVETVRAINSEVRSLLEEMQRGVETLDPDAIRKAATAARNVGSMLRPEVAARVQEAIDAARAAARKIVKAGEAAAVTVDALALAKIKGARTEFLDIDTPAAEVAAPTMQGRAVDLEPDAPAWKREVEVFGAELASEESTGREVKAAFALDLDAPGIIAAPRAAAQPALDLF